MVLSFKQSEKKKPHPNAKAKTMPNENERILCKKTLTIEPQIKRSQRFIEAHKQFPSFAVINQKLAFALFY